MNTKNVLFLIVILIMAQSCTIFSLNPLYHEEDLLELPELQGVWQDTDDGGEYVSLEKLENKRYVFRYMEEQGTDIDGSGTEGGSEAEPSVNKAAEAYLMDTVSFEAGILKLGDHYFMDLYPYYDEEFDEADYLFRGFIPTHSFLKIDWDHEYITLYTFSYDRLKELFEQNRIRIRHQTFEDYIVITASTDELQKFISKYADDEKAFDDPGKFRKIK